MTDRQVAWTMVRGAWGAFLEALWHLCIVIISDMLYKVESYVAPLRRAGRALAGVANTVRRHRQMFVAGAMGFLVGTNLFTVAALAMT